ncbi:MAG: hypothetical protein JXR43_05205 [Burkholderiaceae bacterium]|nr:hypothetical protein [Burkholderiaceae bacterium]
MRETIDFLLHDWRDVASLSATARYAEHRARDKYARFNRLSDIAEPRQIGEGVILPQAARTAWKENDPDATQANATCRDMQDAWF